VNRSENYPSTDTLGKELETLITAQTKQPTISALFSSSTHRLHHPLRHLVHLEYHPVNYAQI